METKLTNEEKKILKVFALTCRSYGADHVLKDYPIEYGNLETYGDWHKDWGGLIRNYSPEDVDRIIIRIMEDSEVLKKLYELPEDYGTLSVNIDCIEKKIEISANYNELISIEKGRSVDLEDYPNLDSIFEEMKDVGVNTGYITFDGGGDSGDIDNFIDYKGQKQHKVNDVVIDNLYNILENFYGGWEINEGSYGSFNFSIDEEKGTKKLYINFNENAYENKSIGTIYYDKF